MKKSGKCILVCAGDLEISEIPVSEEDYVIAVDGGYLYCEVFGIRPDMVIGDFDSLEQAPKEAEGLSVIKLHPVKDDTDTLAALRYGLEKGFLEFHLYGAMGGRLEHTLANIQCLLFLKQQGAAGYIWDGSVMMTVIKEESISFRKEMEGLLSIFAINGAAEGVYEKGLKYELTDTVIDGAYPIGVSNEFIGKQAEVSVRKGTLLVLVRWA